MFHIRMPIEGCHVLMKCIYVYVCRGLFRKLEILPIPCQYMLSLILFIIDNPNNFQTGLEKHGLHINVKINFSFLLQSSQVLKK